MSTLAERMAADAAAIDAQAASAPSSVSQRMQADIAALSPAAAPPAPAPSPAPAPVPLDVQQRQWEAAHGHKSSALLDVPAHLGTSLAASLGGGLRGLYTLATTGDMDKAANAVTDTQDRFTYQPTAPNSQAVLSAVQSPYNPMNYPAVASDYLGSKLAEHGMPGLGAAVDTAGNALPMMLGIRGARAPVVNAVSGGVRKLSEIANPPAPVARIEPSMSGSAAPAFSTQLPPEMATVGQAPIGVTTAAPKAAQAVPAIAQATPELRQAVTAAESRGKPIDPTVLQRHVDADTLPVPVKLTEGQATLDPELISREMNGRGKDKPSVHPDFYNQQGKALAANVDAVRSSVAPDLAPVSDPTTLGQTLVDAYKAKDAPIVADISAKYKALEDANGGQFPIDGQALAANVKAALQAKLKSGAVPADLQSALDEFANGRQMTFEDFETLRSDAADAMRSSSDGRARAAAGIIRQQLEDMPLTPQAAALKPLADSARASAKARFDALEADPAYKAAVGDSLPAGEPSPLADKFINGYVINGRYANVRTMMDNLGADPVAKQAIGASVIDHLRKAGAVDPSTGNFTQNGWNKTVQALGPKLDTVLSPADADVVRRIGSTAKLTQAQPRGSYVNNSNTLVGTLAEATKSSLEGAANVAAHGIPVGTWARSMAKNASQKKAAEKSVAPGAGITRISDLMPPK